MWILAPVQIVDGNSSGALIAKERECAHDDMGGARVTEPDVRCPYCKKKLAERLNGKVEFTCRGCKRKVTIRRT